MSGFVQKEGNMSLHNGERGPEIGGRLQLATDKTLKELGDITAGSFLDEELGQTPRDHEVLRLKRNPDTYEEEVSSDLVTEDYENITKPQDWAFLHSQAKPLRGSRWAFVNPTDEGGGVAMIRPAAVHLMSLLETEAHWGVMEKLSKEEIAERGNPFDFTKQIHNVSQRVSDKRITEAGKALHWYWADEKNGPVLERQPYIRDADFIVIDDPQPAPLIARLRRANPTGKFIWRNHIDTHHDLMADPNTPQGEIARYLLDECGVAGVDAIMAHPNPQFIHPGMHDKTYFVPATLEPFDNLNRTLTPEQEIEGLNFINGEIAEANAVAIQEGRFDDVQKTLSLDPDVNRITIIARFDPSKAMELAMEMGVMTKRKLQAAGKDVDEIVIIGNGSQDDPDGKRVEPEMRRLRSEKYPDEKDSIIVKRVRHNYDAINAVMSRSKIIMQTSYAEGLETRVSDAIKHGKPVVVSNRGGIKAQVIEGKSGVVLDYDKPGYDLERGADFMADLLADRQAYETMVASTKEAAKELNMREFVTVANVCRLLRIGNRLRRGQLIADKHWKMDDMARAEGFQYNESGELAA